MPYTLRKNGTMFTLHNSKGQTTRWAIHNTANRSWRVAKDGTELHKSNSLKLALEWLSGRVRGDVIQVAEGQDEPMGEKFLMAMTITDRKRFDRARGTISLAEFFRQGAHEKADKIL